MSTPLVTEKTYLLSRRMDGTLEARIITPFTSETLTMRWDVLRVGDHFSIGTRADPVKQLAIAILADALGPVDARLLYEGFTREILSKLVIPIGASEKVTFRDVLSWKHNPGPR